jgi:hypothetical protein
MLLLVIVRCYNTNGFLRLGDEAPALVFRVLGVAAGVFADVGGFGLTTGAGFQGFAASL